MLGLGHATVAQDLSLLGGILESTGHLVDAERAHRRAVSIIADDRSAHILVAVAVLSAAANYLAQHAMGGEADALYDRALAIAERSLGSDDATVASVMFGKGLCAWEQGRAADAERQFRQALETDQRQDHHDPSRIARDLNGLAIACYSLGRMDEALAFARRSVVLLDGFARANGLVHHFSGQVSGNLLAILKACGRDDERAQEEFRQIAPDLARLMGVKSA